MSFAQNAFRNAIVFIYLVLQFPMVAWTGEPLLTTELVASGLFRPLLVTAPPGDNELLTEFEERIYAAMTAGI